MHFVLYWTLWDTVLHARRNELNCKLSFNLVTVSCSCCVISLFGDRVKSLGLWLKPHRDSNKDAKTADFRSQCSREGNQRSLS